MIKADDAVKINGHNLKGRNFTLKPVKKETIAKTRSPAAEIT